MIALLKAIGGPGSMGFLAISLAAALLMGLIGPRCQRLSRSGILLLLVGYLLLSLPWVANLIANGISDFRPLDASMAVRGAEAVIVIDGDNSIARVRETKRLFDALAPSMVVVSGRYWFVQSIIDAGVPAQRIRHDGRSSTTREQIANVLMRIDRGSSGQVAIIASRLQMPRVAALVRAAGVQVVFAPSATDEEPPTSGLRLLVPSYTALRVSRDALYEYAALAYYRHRRWIS
jgi:uncharacterized SAM-binding protein YcdF (DUF218 family)